MSCWGENDSGQLGDGTTRVRYLPTRIDAIGDAAETGFGRAHACGVWKSGAVRCWGNNYAGQLGDGSLSGRLRPTPVQWLPRG
jgi:alpha-tubulin suppressor-like RCC1 family protein